MKPTKGLAALGAVLAGSLLATSLVATAAVADDAPGTTTTSVRSVQDASAVATVRVQQQNVVVTAITRGSDTATATLTVRDPKRGSGLTTWNVSPTAEVTGAYKRFSDLRVGFRIHLAGTRAGTANPTADRVVVPGSNKKLVRVDMRKATVLTVGGPPSRPTSMTVRTASGATSTWTLDRARLQGGKHKDLSPGDTVSLRGERPEGAGTGTATTVKIDKDRKAASKKVKPARAKQAEKR